MLLGTYSPVFKTPLGALTTLLPLSIVLVISMVQEGLADVKRHKADDEVRGIAHNIARVYLRIITQHWGHLH
jgi:hypothetical protein